MKLYQLLETEDDPFEPVQNAPINAAAMAYIVRFESARHEINRMMLDGTVKKVSRGSPGKWHWFEHFGQNAIEDTPANQKHIKRVEKLLAVVQKTLDNYLATSLDFESINYDKESTFLRDRIDATEDRITLLSKEYRFNNASRPDDHPIIYASIDLSEADLSQLDVVHAFVFPTQGGGLARFVRREDLNHPVILKIKQLCDTLEQLRARLAKLRQWRNGGE